MSDIRLLKHSFNMLDIKHVPSYLAPYSFVISLPNKLAIICPQDESPVRGSITDSYSCFVLEEESKLELMKATSSFEDILSNGGIDSNVMLVKNSAYIFVDTDSAMDAVMLLTNLGYDVKYQ